MYDFEDEAKKVIDLRDTLVRHAEDAKLLTMDAADLPPTLAQFQQRYKRFVIEKRLQKDRDTTRDKLQMAKHGRFDLLSDEFLSEKAEEEDNDKLRTAFDLSGVQSKLVLQVEAVGGGNVVTPSSAMTSVPTTSTVANDPVTETSAATIAATTATSSAQVPSPVVATSSFTQADQPMYGDDDCMIIREAPATNIISLPSSPTPSPVAPTTQLPQQQPQYSDHAPDGELKEGDDQDDQDDQEEDGDTPPKKKRLSKKQRERRKQLQQQQLMLQHQLRQQLMGQMNASSLDPNQLQPPLPKQPQPPAPTQAQQATQAPAAGHQQHPLSFPPFNSGYNFNVPGMPPMPPMPPGMPGFWPNNFSPPPQPQQPPQSQPPQQQKQRQKKTPDPNEVYGQPSYTDN